ncbi:MAG: glycosyltransferase, partial [Verrucomicrobiales bacterium]
MSRPQRFVFVHYHLRHGGVTKVLLDHARLLSARGHHILIVHDGTSPQPLPPGCLEVVVPEFAYNSEPSPDDTSWLAASLMRQVRADFGAAPDLWHWHNPLLGKNPLLSAVCLKIIKQGEPTVLQCHDFAEDARPQNYLALKRFFGGASFYPTGPRVHYVVSTTRDQQRLQAAGLQPDQVSLLPGIVELPQAMHEFIDPILQKALRRVEQQPTLQLYPTRAITRKNLGEFLLFSALEPEHWYATTLRPENVAEAKLHNFWQATIDELRLPVELGILHGSQSSCWPL